MVVVRFRRSVSFSGSRSNNPVCRSRSTSLPSRLAQIPPLDQLDAAARALRSWANAGVEFQSAGTAAWLYAGVTQLLQSLVELSRLLKQPQTQEQIRYPRRAGSSWPEQILDELLRLADVYGSFRTCLLVLKHHASATRAAIRRRDAARISSSARFQHRADREIARLAAAVRSAASWNVSKDDALAAALTGATAAVATASFTIFAAVAAVSAASETRGGYPHWTNWGSPSTGNSSPGGRAWWRWRKGAVAKMETAEMDAERDGEVNGGGEEMEGKQTMQKLRELERCVEVAESAGDEIFRALVNARVSLLNILTPKF